MVQNVPGEAFFVEWILYAAVMFVFESVAETLSVWFDDPVSAEFGTIFVQTFATCSLTQRTDCSDSRNAEFHELLVST